MHFLDTSLERRRNVDSSFPPATTAILRSLHGTCQSNIDTRYQPWIIHMDFNYYMQFIKVINTSTPAQWHHFITSHIEVFENSPSLRDMYFVRNLGLQTQVLEEDNHQTIYYCFGKVSLDHKGNVGKRLPYMFYPYLSQSGFSYRGPRSLEDMHLEGLLGGKEAMRRFFHILCPNNEVRLACKLL